MASSDFFWLLNQAYFFLKFRPRTKKEIKDYLFKKIKKQPQLVKEVDQVIKKLEEERLIDDKQFINWFVDQRLSSKIKSRFALTTELLRLGVDKKLIDQYFAKNPLDEEKLALKLISLRLSRIKDIPKEKQIKKAINFLRQRGFSWEIIKKTINEIKEDSF